MKKKTKAKKAVLSKGQNRLLQHSVKRLLGPALLEAEDKKTEFEAKYNFLQTAINTGVLNGEWLS